MNIFETFHKIHLIIKCLGSASYTLNYTGNKPVIKVTKLDVTLVVLHSFLITIFFILGYWQRITFDEDLVETEEHFYHLSLLYLGYLFIVILNFLFNLTNRFIFYEILKKIHKIDNIIKKFEIWINYIFIFNRIMLFFCVQVTCCIVYIVLDIILYPTKILTLTYLLFFGIYALLTETKMIFFTFVSDFFMNKINRRFYEYTIKDSKYFSRNYINTFMILHNELFEICTLIVKGFKHIIVRIFITFSTAIFFIYWVTIIMKEKQLTPLALFMLIFWFLSHVIGQIFIVYFCSSTAKEVSKPFF